MRKRLANPHAEAHGRLMRCYDFFMPAGTDPHQATLDIEADLPHLKLWHRGDGEVHGYVNTSTRPDGTLYVCVHLYSDDCGCDLHEGVSFKKAPMTGAHEAKLAEREHPAQKLTAGPEGDALLKAHGFRDRDGAIRA
jgi:hypothetical protein